MFHVIDVSRYPSIVAVNTWNFQMYGDMGQDELVREHLYLLTNSILIAAVFTFFTVICLRADHKPG